jgi:GT2 family glycosyltransferase
VKEGKPQSIGVVIVTFNSAETIRSCVESALASNRVAHVVVVDNASSDDTVDHVPRLDPRVEVVNTGANLGFGRAANLGAARLETEYLAFVNPDAVATPDVFDVLGKHFETHEERAWAAGPALLDDAGDREYSARGFPSIWSGLVNRRWLDHFPRSRNGELRRFLMLDADRNASFDAEWLSGAFIVVRRSVFEQLGGFDPAFFLYYEEIDLFRRARSLGYTARFVGEAVAHHSIGGSSRGISFRAAQWRVLSLRRYFLKHLRRGLGDSVVFWCATALGIALEAPASLSRLARRWRGASKR